MRVSTGGNLFVETVTLGVRVMRFARPDLRRSLDDIADSATSLLFREIQGAVLSDLPKGWTLVVNLGLVDAISAAFYRCLLYIRKCVQARQGRLVLCGLTPLHQEIFDLFRGPEVFTIVGTEAEARRVVREGLSDREMICSPKPAPRALRVSNAPLRGKETNAANATHTGAGHPQATSDRGSESSRGAGSGCRGGATCCNGTSGGSVR